MSDIEKTNGELIDMLDDLVSEIRKYHGDFDARLFVEAERLLARFTFSPTTNDSTPSPEK
jgi:hypothetical protein